MRTYMQIRQVPTKHGLDDFPLYKHSKTFVHPKVVPRLIGDAVAHP